MLGVLHTCKVVVVSLTLSTANRRVWRLLLGTTTLAVMSALESVPRKHSKLNKKGNASVTSWHRLK